ncbi:WhiB family transcriptional regulator [Sphaerisporangium corydalis]|uniref:WhiB family transcriptional regulator n=1 Tax=Sphaerisporangium corydalis TaxID=1441875 RepID=A0ABV9EJM3_9ACTN|nr:WhiB family transcriptional regulator [Sphaerisporangium corydalis]
MTAELHRRTSISGSPVWAAVERYEGRLVKVCGTAEDAADLVTLARAAAWTYGAAFTPVHPSALAIAGAPGVLAENAECVYDPELHVGPKGGESAEDQAAREAVAREVCAPCPARLVCGIYALKVRPDSGVWAGMTPAEIDAEAEAAWREAA